MEKGRLSNNMHRLVERLGHLPLAACEVVDNAMEVWDEEDTFLPGVELYQVTETHLVRGEE